MLEGYQSFFFLFEGDHVPDFLSDIQQYEAVLMGSKTYEFGFQFGAKPGEPGYKGFETLYIFELLQFESNEEVELIEGTLLRLLKTSNSKVTESYGFAGGGELAGSLLKHKLIDQLVLKVNPVIIGEGIPLFGSVKPSPKIGLS